MSSAAHAISACSVQILRGQENRFAQSCERHGAEVATQGFLAAVEYDLDVLSRMAVPDDVLLQWLGNYEAATAEESAHPDWTRAGVGMQERQLTTTCP